VTWGNIKKGDAVIACYGLGGVKERQVKTTVKSVGPQWITTAEAGAGAKYAAVGGYGSFGWSLHTTATLDEWRRREAATRTLREALRLAHSLPLAALEAAAAALVPS
jgi:hypothetical protein